MSLRTCPECGHEAVSYGPFLLGSMYGQNYRCAKCTSVLRLKHYRASQTISWVFIGLTLLLGFQERRGADTWIPHWGPVLVLLWLFAQSMFYFFGSLQRRDDTPESGARAATLGNVMALWLLAGAALYSTIRDIFIMHRESAWPWAVITIVIVYMAVERTGKYRSLTAPGHETGKGA
ncbi:MAG: hypothetical protein NTW97_05425 [Candidatus Krumholzibacteria bacterium]|nr:hypothetical protein [Candidatus Krumholzibacteria bacterium]